MSDTPVQFEYAPGETLSVELHTTADAATANSPYTATEETNRDGLYEITVDDAVTGLHRINILSGGVSVGSAWVNIAADDTTVYAAAKERVLVEINSLSSADVEAAVEAALDDYEAVTETFIGAQLSSLNTLAAKFSGITSVAGWLRLLARSDAGAKTDEAVSLGEINADGGSGAGDYDNETDAPQAAADGVPRKGQPYTVAEQGGDTKTLTMSDPA